MTNDCPICTGGTTTNPYKETCFKLNPCGKCSSLICVKCYTLFDKCPFCRNPNYGHKYHLDKKEAIYALLSLELRKKIVLDNVIEIANWL